MKESRNRDRFRKKNYPIQTYAISGHEEGAVTGDNNDKNTLDGPPMVITPTPPGAYAYSDDAWAATFGASMDAWLTLYPGVRAFANNSETESSIIGGSNFVDALPYANNMSLYKQVLGQQQIKWLASEDTVTESQNVSKVSKFQNVRSIGIRGPMQMGGWGKTIGLRPTDPATTARENDDEHKLDAASWKFGPVDLRWDEDRKIWRGFNDLIADARNSPYNHGTLVFGTNPDLGCGFPYLKGKLEDAWWVRKTDKELNVTGKDNDRDKSGSVLTHLEHGWFDVEESCYAPMNSIFLIHRDPKSPATCGNETTYKSAAIELYHDVYFHHRICPTKHGPINFICKDASDCDKKQAGKMIFVDGLWSPAIDIDVCSSCVGGGQFGITFKNDVALAKKICEVCNLVLQLHGFGKQQPKPKEMSKSADAAGKAGESSGDAADRFGAITPTNNESLADAAAGAEDAYRAAGNAHDTSEAAQNTAASDQGIANDAAATATATREKLDNAYEKSDSNYIDTDGDGKLDSLKPGHAAQAKIDDAARDAALADAIAADAISKEKTETANDSKEASDKARETADAASADAKEAHEEWKEEKAKDGSELTDAERQADEAAEQADADAEAAKNAGENANETPQSAEDCCKKNAGAIEDLVKLINDENGLGGLGDAIGNAEQKVNDAIQNAIDAVEESMEATLGDINAQLAELGGGTVVRTPVNRDGTFVEQNAVDEVGTGDPAGDAGEGGGTSVPNPDGSGGTGVGNPPPGGQAGDGGPTVPPTDAPDTPDCGVISLTDPCSSRTKVISCKGGPGTGGKGSPDTTTPEGEPNAPDPGVGEGSPGLHGDPDGGTGLGLGQTGGGWAF